MALVCRARSPQDVLFRAGLDEIAARRGADVVHVHGQGRDLLSTVRHHLDRPR